MPIRVELDLSAFANAVRRVAQRTSPSNRLGLQRMPRPSERSLSRRGSGCAESALLSRSCASSTCLETLACLCAALESAQRLRELALDVQRAADLSVFEWSSLGGRCRRQVAAARTVVAVASYPAVCVASVAPTALFGVLEALVLDIPFSDARPTDHPAHALECQR